MIILCVLDIGKFHNTNLFIYLKQVYTIPTVWTYIDGKNVFIKNTV